MSKRQYAFPPAFLRPDAAAHYAGVSVRQLLKWVEEGKIRPPHKPSPQIALFPRRQLEADIAALCGISPNATNEETNEWDTVIR